MFRLNQRVSSSCNATFTHFARLLTLDLQELFEAVRASLRAKVAALSEDNWMYEKEDEPRLV